MNQQARSNSMPLGVVLTTTPYHSPSGRETVSRGVQPEPDGPSGSVVVENESVVVADVVTVVVTIAVVAVVTVGGAVVTAGAGISVTAPPDPVHAETRATVTHPTSRRRPFVSAKAGE
ncbi:MAG: hypothetical protein ACRDXF_11805 [Acidimicrobiia bacterium]